MKYILLACYYKQYALNSPFSGEFDISPFSGELPKASPRDHCVGCVLTGRGSKP